MMRKLAVLLLLFAVGGCSEDDGGTGPDPQVASMTGRWVGSASGVTADANLTESNRQVSGSGTMATPMGNLPITVSGTNNHPQVSLTIRSPNQPDGSFTGRFTDANTVDGTLLIQGFPQVALTLRRQ